MPEIASLRLKAWRSQDWCRYIDYARGEYALTDYPSTCELNGSIEKTAPPFDPTAQHDYDAVSRQLERAAPGVYIVEIDFKTQGEVALAEFDLPCDRCDKLAYIYEPGYTDQMGDRGPDRYTAVSADWYIYEEDVR